MNSFITRVSTQKLWVVFWVYSVPPIIVVGCLAQTGTIPYWGTLENTPPIVSVCLTCLYAIWHSTVLWKCTRDTSQQGWSTIASAYAASEFMLALTLLIILLIVNALPESLVATLTGECTCARLWYPPPEGDSCVEFVHCAFSVDSKVLIMGQKTFYDAVARRRKLYKWGS